MEKSITLKEIVGFLPYGLQIYRLAEANNPQTVKLTTGVLMLWEDNYYDEFKPIVRPMSDLTKEIEHNGETFVPLVKHVESMGEPVEDFDPFFLTDYEQAVLNIMSTSDIRTQYDLEFLLEHHFDIYEWIKDGLAVDLNNL